MLLRRSKPERVTVICPSCHHQQREYAEANSTFCHACGHRFQLHSKRIPSYRTPDNRVRRKKTLCPHCAHDLFIPESALSWQCQHCTQYLDLRDYSIDRAFSKSIHTFGKVDILPKGSFQASKLIASHLTIRGRCSGSLLVHETLVVDAEVSVTGRVEAQTLIIEPGASLTTSREIKAARWQVEGNVKAQQIESTRELVLTAGATLRCRSLHYTRVKAHEGATLEADLASPIVGAPA